MSRRLFWIPPRLWEGETVFIIGGGPTLFDTDLSPLLDPKCHVIGVNEAWRLGPWIVVCWFGDRDIWEWHKEEMRTFGGIFATRMEINDPYLTRLVRVAQGKNLGIDARTGRVAWNRSSGASAINLAYHFGAKTIVLLGFDMHIVDGRHNYHSLHKVKQKGNPYPFFLKTFQSIAEDAEKLGVRIVNCTPGSAIEQFPIMKLSVFLKEERGRNAIA